MFVVLNLFLLKVLLSTVFVSSNDILFRKPFHETQEQIDETDFHRNNFKIYDTSKHVFYWLYTRDEPNGKILNRSEPLMTESTTYNAKNPTKIIVHGWLGVTQDKDGLCTYIVRSYLNVSENNVICVDWKRYTTDIPYVVARIRAKHVAQDIAKVLQRITNNMTEGVERVHLMGYSMGAHIVGFTGKILPHQIPRITGLDPAKPMYENSDPEDRLDKTDARFVDVVHTDGDNYGIFKSLGDVDFFPNGGKTQPSCAKTDKSSGPCSHMKSYRYFAHSIWAKDDYVAVKCSNWEKYLANECGDHVDITYFGEYVDKKKTGDYFLKTTDTTEDYP